MIIARRELTVLDEPEAKVLICLFAPEVHSEKSCSCRTTIAWPHGTVDRAGWGVDEVQAIHPTLQSIGVELYFSAYHKAGKLIWDAPGAGYGFPVPKNAREMLVGEDARFDG